MKPILPLMIAGLAACSPTIPTEVARGGSTPAIDLPPMKSFALQPAAPATRSNGEILQDFLDLSFQMESGRSLPWMTRFSGPIKVAVRGDVPPSLNNDLAKLLSRLRNEARIDISTTSSLNAAQIVIEAVPQKALQKAVPQAACFVVPNVAGWNQFKRNRGRAITDWTQLKSRTRSTVIIPSDAAPQEVRDCLHEEVAQALGPLNDLYRLPDSIFNDDNFHTVLTGFDMLILRAYYAPELRNGMTRAQAAQALPAVLSRINPRGNAIPARPQSMTPRAWNDAISQALAPSTSSRKRVKFAREAVKLATDRGWNDNRMAFSLFVEGRVTLGTRPRRAIESFIRSGQIYRARYGSSVHTAHVATQMSAFALSAGNFTTAVKITDEAIPAAQRSQNAALMATLMMIKAEALDKLGRGAEAQALRLDSFAWGRYGFGSEMKLRARLAEVRALTPRRGS